MIVRAPEQKRRVVGSSGFLPSGAGDQLTSPAASLLTLPPAAEPVTMRSLDPWGLARQDLITPTARKAGLVTSQPNFFNRLLNAEADHLRALTIGSPNQPPLVNLAPATMPVTTSSLLNAVINQNTAGTFTIVGNYPGAYLEIYEVFLYNQTKQTLEFFDGATSLSGPLTDFPAGGGFLFNFTGEPHWILSLGTALKLSLSAAAQVSGFVKFRSVSL